MWPQKKSTAKTFLGAEGPNWRKGIFFFGGHMHERLINNLTIYPKKDTVSCFTISAVSFLHRGHASPPQACSDAVSEEHVF